MVVVRSLRAATISTRCIAPSGYPFFNELAAMLWGRAALYTNIPEYLSGHVELLPPALPAVPPGHHRGRARGRGLAVVRGRAARAWEC